MRIDTPIAWGCFNGLREALLDHAPCQAQDILIEKVKADLIKHWTAAPIDAGSRDVGMAEPFLDFGNVCYD